MSELARDSQNYVAHPEKGRPINLEPLHQRALATNDPNFASDLVFCSDIAQNLSDVGARTMVVGGYVRDLVMSELTGSQSPVGDLDLEVYGMLLNKLQA